jgi:hypothetical protein
VNVPFIAAVLVCGVVSGVALCVGVKRKGMNRYARSALVTVSSLALLLVLTVSLLIANSAWRRHVLRQFVQQAVQELEEARIPQLSPHATQEQVADIESLKGRVLRTPLQIEVLDYFGFAYYMRLRCAGQQVYVCVVDDQKLSFFGTPKLALRELRLSDSEQDDDGS